MKSSLLIIATLAISLFGCCEAEKPGETQAVGAKQAPAFDDYGEGVSSRADLIPIPEIVAAPALFDGKTVTVKGVIASVCPSAGCFLYLGEGASQMKIDLMPNGFTVPKGQNMGHVAYAAGKIVAAGGEAVMVATGVRIQEK